jgi:hypothetical protein
VKLGVVQNDDPAPRLREALATVAQIGREFDGGSLGACFDIGVA